MRLDQLTQERLALVVCSAASGRQLRTIPVYAEIALLKIVSEQPPIQSEQFNNLRQRNPELARKAQDEMQRQVDAAWLQAHRDSFLQLALAELESRGFDVLRRGDQAMLDEVMEAVKRASLRAAAPAPPATAQTTFDGRRVPLGVLATDHTGYVSYDLTRMNWEAILPKAQWASCGLEFRVFPMLLERNQVIVLNQLRYANDAIFAKIEISHGETDPTPEASLNLPAMQNPSLLDWRLSPGSFAAVPQQLIGADGCEALTPTNFAVSEFHMRQVVRLNEQVGAKGHPKAHVYEYAVSLIPIGHSLGEIKYALPLAPGETVRLAVIDWRRTDSAARTESTSVTEALLHDQAHDRMITEMVRGALDEWQRGGSVMGGLGGGAGVSGQSGNTSIVGGGMLSLGGAYATSSGSRDVAVDTTQKVTEAIHQSSVGQRELHSSVIVQSDQLERQNVETRAFSNNNRGHTLTVLYYEVLRHFRVETRYSRRYDAVLLPRQPVDLRNDIFLMANRHVLAPALLNPGLAPAFDALERIDRTRKERIRNPPIAVVPFDQANIVFTNFQVESRIGSLNTPDDIIFFIKTKDGVEHTLPFANGINANYKGDFDENNHNIHLMSGTLSIRWGDIDKIVFKKLGPGKVGATQMDIVGHFPGDTRRLYDHQPSATYVIEGDLASVELTPVNNPPPPPPPQPAQSFEQALSLDDYALSERLKDHLAEQAEYYSRIFDLSRNPNSWARRLENEIWESVPAVKQTIDMVAPTPLEVLGSRIAFPLLTQERQTPQDIPLIERLISLPTRGIFAEAKLGHCNVAEEIDETRFWRWDEHPIPFVASDIGAVDPISPKPRDTNLAPTSMPAPVVTIQTPTSLPQPTGMADSLKLLATPNIFRDMSMGTELGGFLKDLINGSVSMADAATKAQDIKSKLNTQMDKQQRDQTVALTQSQADLEKSRIEAEHARAQQVTPAEAQHTSKLADNLAAKGTISKEEAKQVTKNQLANVKGSQPPSQSKVKLQLYFKHGRSKQFLEGNFSVTVEGPSIEMADLVTDRSGANMEIPKWPPGEYGIAISGYRTKLPELAGTTVHVPAIGTREAFDVVLNRYAETKGLLLTGSGKFKLESNSTAVVLVVLATEEVSEVTKEIDYSRQQGVNLQAQTSFGAEIGKFELGVVLGGTSIDVGQNSEKYSIKIAFTYLTGGLEVT